MSRLRALTWFAAAVGLPALAPAADDAPPVRTVHDFVAPLFDLKAGGVKVGELRGATATYTSPELADFGQFKYQAFAPDRSVLYTVESDSAMVFLKQRLALGEGTLHVTSPDFELTGRDWRCDVNAQQVTIQQGTRIVFRAEIGNILK